MRIVEFIPKYRDNTAKEAYKLMDWYYRKERKNIKKQLDKYMIDYILYGKEPIFAGKR